MYDFKFTDIGEGLHEGQILKWFVKVGDYVKEGDTLVTVETDKVNAELPSPATGTIISLGKKKEKPFTLVKLLLLLMIAVLMQ